MFASIRGFFDIDTPTLSVATLTTNRTLPGLYFNGTPVTFCLYSTVDSTNTYLLSSVDQLPLKPVVIGAESQTAGRGQRGKRWISHTSRQQLIVSVAFPWTSSESPSALSLGVGMHIAQWLRDLIPEQSPAFSLKWPNDIWYHEHKCAGILVELAQSLCGQLWVIIGVGVNYHPIEDSSIDQSVACLFDASNTLPPYENLMIGLSQSILNACDQAQKWGVKTLLSRWDNYDGLRDKQVEVTTPHRIFRGTASGLDSTGALLIQVGDTQHAVVSGSVRLADTLSTSQ